VTVGAGMIEEINDNNAEADSRIYSEVEKEVNAYIYKHFPEWGCKHV
jgi:sulfate adenylyltransferase subunit 1